MTAKTVRTFSVPINVGLFTVNVPAQAEVVGIVSAVFGMHAGLVVELPETERASRTVGREFRVVRDGDPIRGGRYVGSFHVPGANKSVGHVYEV